MLIFTCFNSFNMKTLFLLIFFEVGLFTLLNAQNQPPVAVNDTVYAYSGEQIKVQLLKNDYDPDGDSIKVTFISPGYTQINDSTWSRTIYFAVDYSTDPKINTYIITDSSGATSNGFIVYINKYPFSPESLDINNFSALISPFGHHFWDFESSGLEVPQNSGKSAVLNSCLWIGGQAESNFFHLAAEEHRQVGADFWNGPISTNSDTNFMKRWQQVYKINKSDIQYHINNWNTANYKPIKVIANWPAHGDISNGESENLAPFYDANHNSTYEPQLGDYPVIRGDQAIFFVFNDSLRLHTESQGKVLGIEIVGMAYAYDKPDDSTLFNTIFFHYEIANKSARNYHDMRLSLFSDFDLGDPNDDYLLTDVTNGMIIGYNGDDMDGDGTGTSYGAHPPAIGMKIISGPLMPEDGIDNPAGECNFGINGLNFGDNIIDNERIGMTHSNYIVNGSWNLPFNYYGAMNNTGVQYGCFGNGDSLSGVGPACNYIFPHNSDTLCNWGTQGVLPNGGFNQNGFYWNEQTVGNFPSDRRGIGSICNYTMNAGETIELDFCYTWARDYEGDNKSSVELLRNRMTQLSPQLNLLIHMPKNYLGKITQQAPSQLTIAPNPACDYIVVNTNSSKAVNCFIYNSNGILMSEGLLQEGSNKINITHLKPGMYVIQSEAGYSKFIKL